MQHPPPEDAVAAAARPLPLPSFFENVGGGLEPGEFWANPERLFYRPLEDSPPRDGWVPVQEVLLSAHGLRDVSFVDIGFAHATWRQPARDAGYVPVQSAVRQAPCGGGGGCEPPAAVEIAASRDVSFVNCSWRQMGAAYALSVGGGSRGVRVKSCDFSDLSGGAIKLANVDDARARSPSPAEWDEDFEVRRCSVSDAALEFRGAAAIFVGYVRRLTLAQSTVRRTGYTAISVGWGWGRVTSFARENTISHNLVSDAMEALNDGGCIYTLGPQPDSLLEGNVCVRDRAAVVGCFYHDNGSRGWLTRRNVAEASPAPCIYLQGISGLPASDISVSELWCRNTAPVSNGCASQNCTIDARSLHLVHGEWPAAARAIIGAAGADAASSR